MQVEKSLQIIPEKSVPIVSLPVPDLLKAVVTYHKWNWG